MNFNNQQNRSKAQMDIKGFLETQLAERTAANEAKDAEYQKKRLAEDSRGLLHLIGVCLTDNYNWQNDPKTEEIIKNEVLALNCYEQRDHPGWLFAKYSGAKFAYDRENGQLHLFKGGQFSAVIEWMRDLHAMLIEFKPLPSPDDCTPRPAATRESLTAKGHNLRQRFHELPLNELNAFVEAGIGLDVQASGTFSPETGYIYYLVRLKEIHNQE